ncbi:MAG: hypothetical protein SFV17_27905 [Candidatus Obscuribacter sp.]|nr:hypothetical protein [Candidatus Obscuribacter sp.]
MILLARILCATLLITSIGAPSLANANSPHKPSSVTPSPSESSPGFVPEEDSRTQLTEISSFPLAVSALKTKLAAMFSVERSNDGSAIFHSLYWDGKEQYFAKGLKVYEPDKGWFPLSKTVATALFGFPVESEEAGVKISTFDVFSDGQERNLFHIDVQFDEHGNSISYRVRGIGIGAPAWVLEKNCPVFSISTPRVTH